MSMMQSTLDKSGRVVVPKPIRDELRLVPGTVLNFEQRAGKVILRPLFCKEPMLTRQDGVLVYDGQAVGELDGAVEAQRKERQERLMAMGR